MKNFCLMTYLSSLFEKLVAEKFWGELTIKFKNGHVITVQKSEQIKINND